MDTKCHYCHYCENKATINTLVKDVMFCSECYANWANRKKDTKDGEYNEKTKTLQWRNKKERLKYAWWCKYFLGNCHQFIDDDVLEDMKTIL